MRGAATASDDSHSTLPVPSLQYEPINLPPNCSQCGDDAADCLAVVLDNVLTRAECDALSSRAAPHFSVPTAVRSDDGSVVPLRFAAATEYELVVHDDPTTGDELWRRMAPRLARVLGPFSLKALSGAPLGVCSRLRVLRYASRAHRFDPHYDRIVVEDDGVRRSLLTVLLYLNDGDGVDFAGGETCFLDAAHPHGARNSAAVTPRAGRAVVFEHGLYHSGSPLGVWRCKEKKGQAQGEGDEEEDGDESAFLGSGAPHGGGAKYILRTDVLFAAQAWASAAAPRRETERERAMRELCDQAEAEAAVDQAYLDAAAEAEAKGAVMCDGEAQDVFASLAHDSNW